MAYERREHPAIARRKARRTHVLRRQLADVLRGIDEHGSQGTKAPAKIVFAQLCDAKKLVGKRTDDELLQEARFARLPAGTGELPLYDFMNALPAGLEVEYEVARIELADRSPLEKAQAAAQDAARFMAAYEASKAKVAA